MAGSAIKGIAGAQGAVGTKQQGKIEGLVRNISRQENKSTPNTTAARNPDAGNKVKMAASEGAGNKTRGVRTGVENNIQRQAKNLNSANNIASNAQTGRGQNVNEVV